MITTSINVIILSSSNQIHDHSEPIDSSPFVQVSRNGGDSKELSHRLWKVEFPLNNDRSCRSGAIPAQQLNSCRRKLENGAKQKQKKTKLEREQTAHSDRYAE